MFPMGWGWLNHQVSVKHLKQDEGTEPTEVGSMWGP